MEKKNNQESQAKMISLIDYSKRRLFTKKYLKTGIRLGRSIQKDIKNGHLDNVYPKHFLRYLDKSISLREIFFKELLKENGHKTKRKTR